MALHAKDLVGHRGRPPLSVNESARPTTCGLALASCGPASGSNGADPAQVAIADAYVDGGKATRALAIVGIRHRFGKASGERDGSGARRCRSHPIGPAVDAMHGDRDGFA
ncbi:hypothetical protein [Burkholderia sola]|uniref:hypothetical protein n=1 Tax=Burkholderia sola TaxID=2843302 RepID=UPI0023DD6B7D|nr:hypothetical protein [Burkholderia sola]MDF3082029.1 hypothetical protein [Burkholderia sola]